MGASLATKAFLVDSLASIMINMSLSVMKMGHRSIEDDADKRGRYGHLRSPVWWTGFLLLLAGTLIQLVVIPYVDISLLATTTGLTIIFNNILAITLFDEKWILKYDLPAMLCIIGGCLSVVLLSDKT